MQRGRRRPLSFSVKAADEFFWPPSYPADRVQKLLDDGAVVPVEDGMFKLADWENWSY
jgi:hypothetical protein